MRICIESAWFCLFLRTARHYDICKDVFGPWTIYVRFGGYQRKGFRFGEHAKTTGPVRV